MLIEDSGRDSDHVGGGAVGRHDGPAVGRDLVKRLPLLELAAHDARIGIGPLPRARGRPSVGALAGARRARIASRTGPGLAGAKNQLVSDLARILAVFGLVSVNAFFVVGEYAMVVSRRVACANAPTSRGTAASGSNTAASGERARMDDRWSFEGRPRRVASGKEHAGRQFGTAVGGFWLGGSHGRRGWPVEAFSGFLSTCTSVPSVPSVGPRRRRG